MAIKAGAVAGVVTTLAVVLAGCSNAADGAARASPPAPTPTPTPTATASRPATVPAPAVTPRRARPRPPARASVTIPSIGVRSLRVIPYKGRPDDLPGTRIQNRGLAASPHGPRGGVGPGEIGNYIITAHRTSAGGPFRELPALRRGDHILIKSGGAIYDYEVAKTMRISFRSARDLARQSAPVPGYPGRRPTRAMITLSTCATPEDHAEGNYWEDALGNPEHRIDKVGVLVGVRPASR